MVATTHNSAFERLCQILGECELECLVGRDGEPLAGDRFDAAVAEFSAMVQRRAQEELGPNPGEVAECILTALASLPAAWRLHRKFPPGREHESASA